MTKAGEPRGFHMEWSIGIYEGPSPFVWTAAGGVANPVLSAADVCDVAASFVADPFMVSAANRWHMFFEVWNRGRDLGEIGVARSADLLAWTYERIVLSEPFHLSYPFVFQWRGDFFMIPETRQAGSIRLYRAAVFPWKWTFEKCLFDGDFADATLAEFGERWWMFVLRGHEELALYSARSPLDRWTEHPSSPLVTGDRSRLRPGGRVVMCGNRLIRFTQDGVPLYGSRVRAMAVESLTPDSYREAEVESGPVLRRSRRGWNSAAMHHIDPHEIAPGKWIACVDGAALSRRAGGVDAG